VQLRSLDAAKKTLILDLDFTLIDTDVFNATSLSPRHWCRPHLHEMLAAVSRWYNLVLWSATGNAHIEHKLAEAGVLASDAYAVALLVDYGAMIRISVQKEAGGATKSFNTKPLSVLYGIWPEMKPESTLMCDDHRRSFFLNAANGIHVSGYRSDAVGTDRELLLLTQYLLAVKASR